MNWNAHKDMPVHDGLVWPDTMPRTKMVLPSVGASFLYVSLSHIQKALAQLSYMVSLRVSNVIASFNSGSATADDAGFVVYFKLGRNDRFLACDRYSSVEANAAAVIKLIRHLHEIAENVSIACFNQIMTSFDQPLIAKSQGE